MYIRGVDENMQVTEDFVEVVPVKGTTTGTDRIVSLIGADWTKTVSLATGVATKWNEKTADCELRPLNPVFIP